MYLYDFILHEPCKGKKNYNKRYTDQMILVEYRYIGINVRIIRCENI